MTDLPPPPPPMPGPPQMPSPGAPPAQGYWQASDGRWYPPTAAPGYGQPPYQPPAKTNGLAIAAMVLGILWIYWIGSILALVFGYVSKSQIDKSGGRQAGRGMAIAGIVLGWIGVGLLALFVAIAVLGASATTNFSSTGSQINSIPFPR